MASAALDGIVIPRIFHRVWLGGARMPDEFERFGDTWLEHNPGWEMMTWTDENLPPLRNQEQFETSQHHAQQAALARYEVLAVHGGVYVDTDFECLRNIDPLLEGASFVAGWADGELVNNALIGCVPQHPVMVEMIDVIPYRISTRPGQQSTYQSGVVLLTETATTHAVSDPTILIHESNLLYPYHWTEKERRTEDFSEAYAIHHWEASWVPAAA